jgi:hypothetical protein
MRHRSANVQTETHRRTDGQTNEFQVGLGYLWFLQVKAHNFIICQREGGGEGEQNIFDHMSANPTKKVGGKNHYRGQMKNGMAHGSGKITFAEGNEYKGEWENGKMHGNGIMKFANGDVYEGEWENGKEHAVV